MSPALVFRFHDVADVEVRSDSAFVQEFFEAEYGYHHVQDNPERQLPGVRLDLRLSSAAPTGFTRHVHKLLARWSYRLALQPGRVDVDVYANRTAVPMVHHMLVHPSLRWLAATRRDTLLLHAGAVVKDGRSLIFTGKGGAGKTTSTSLVLAAGDGWQLHADDYVFLRSGPQSLAYMTRSHLYRDLLRWVPEVGASLSPAERTRLEFFGAVRRYSGERLKWPVRLGPQRLWPGKLVADRAVPAAILLLERADIALPGLLRLDETAAVASDLLEMNFGEARHFLALLEKAGRLDRAWLTEWQAAERSLLASLLAEVPAYRLLLPARLAAPELKAALLPLLTDLVSA